MASLPEKLVRFVQERDSAYLVTASADGQPYVQHRGGPPGFLKVLGPDLLGFADYSGNRQYLSVQNLRENDQAFLFLMDLARRRRVKLWGRARFVEDDPALTERVRDPDYPAVVERVLCFTVERWSVNCPQHIVPRFTLDELLDRYTATQWAALQEERAR